MTLLNLSDYKYRKESIKNNKYYNESNIVQRIKTDSYLREIFSKISSKDLFNVLIPLRIGLTTYKLEQQIQILKLFWKSFEKITQKDIASAQKELSIFKKIALKIIFSSWQEILIYSENSNNKDHHVTQEGYFDNVNKFLFSTESSEIITILRFLKIDDIRTAFDFWKQKEGAFKNYVPHHKQKQLERTIKFALSCKRTSKEFILGKKNSEFDNCEILLYKFNDLNPKKLISYVQASINLCFFEKGFYDYSFNSKDIHQFDLGACLSANKISMHELKRSDSSFGKGRYTPFGIVGDEIGFQQKEKKEKALIENYKYVHYLKDLEILIFISSDERDLKLNQKISHKYQK